MSKAAFKRTLRRRVGSDRPERKPLLVPAPPPRREYLEPSDEQLARFVVVLTFGPPAAGIAWCVDAARDAIRDPVMRRRWLQEHRDLQEYAASLETDPQTEPSREDGGRKS